MVEEETEAARKAEKTMREWSDSELKVLNVPLE